MSAILIDSNVLLDVMTENAQWATWSANALATAANSARLVINAIIYAEIFVHFSRIEDLEAALPRGLIDRELHGQILPRLPPPRRRQNLPVAATAAQHR